MIPDRTGRAPATASTLFVLLLTMTASYASVVPAFDGVGPSSSQSRAAEPATAQWPMFGGFENHTGVAPPTAKGISEPILLWDAIGPTNSIQSLGTLIGNFSGNIEATDGAVWERGGNQVVQIDDNAVQVLEGKTGRLMWEAELPDAAAAMGAPGLTDLDRDGRLDIVVASFGGNVTAFEPKLKFNGSGYSWDTNAYANEALWRRYIDAQIPQASVLLGDLTNDGIKDVVVQGDRTLWVFNGSTGSPIVKNHILNGNITATPALYHFGPGDIRIVTTSWSPATSRFHVDMMNTKNQTLGYKYFTTSGGLGYGIGLTHPIIASPTVGDVDSDAEEEVVIATPFEDGNGVVHILSGDLGEEAAVAVPGILQGTPAMGDVDGDGDVEVVVAATNGTLLTAKTHILVIGASGVKEWDKDLNSTQPDMAISSPVLADVNKDGVLDIIYTTLNGSVLAIDAKAKTILWNTTVGRSQVATSLAAGDADGNGFLDLAIDGLLLTHDSPDLMVTADGITYNVSTAVEDGKVRVSAIVENVGTKNVPDVAVAFYDYYNYVETYFATDHISVDRQGAAAAEGVLTVQGGGDHVIRVVVDPDHLIDESDETNNAAMHGLKATSHYSITITPDKDRLIIDPGDKALFTLKVANTGDQANRIVLSASAPDGWGTQLGRTDITLDPGKQMDVALMVTSDAAAARKVYDVNVTGISQNKTTNRYTRVLELEIRGQYGLSLKCDNPDIGVNGEGIGEFQIGVTNEGNAPDTFNLATVVPADTQWLVQLSDKNISLEGENSTNVTVTVTPPLQPLPGDTLDIAFSVVSRSSPNVTAEVALKATVAVPDLVPVDIKAYRRDGKEASSTSGVNLVAGKESFIEVDVVNVKANVDRLGDVAIGVYLNGKLAFSDMLTFTFGDVATTERRPVVLPQGDTTFDVMVDEFNDVAETNDDNNNLNETFTVIPPKTNSSFYVYGKVMDEQHRALRNAIVTVNDQTTGESMNRTTDADGNYSMDLRTLPSGYGEEDTIEVVATDNVTVSNFTFLVYSQDKWKKVDVVLIPGPYDFYISVNAQTIEVSPGETATYSVLINQMGNGTNNISLSMETRKSDWSTTLTDEEGKAISMVNVLPGSHTTLLLKVVTREDDQSDEEGEVSVMGTSQADPTRTSRITTRTIVSQVFDITMYYRTTGGEPGTDVMVNVSLENKGNGPDDARMSVISNPGGWSISFSPENVSLGYHQTGYVMVTVSIPLDATLGTHNLSFAAVHGVPAREALMNVNLAVSFKEYPFTMVSTLGTDNLEVRPGENYKVSISLSNEAREQNEIALNLSDVPDGWDVKLMSVNGQMVDMVLLYPLHDPTGMDLANLDLSIDVPREVSGVREATMRLVASSLNDLSQFRTIDVNISVLAVDLSLSALTIESGMADGQLISLSVRVTNTGTIDLEDEVPVRFFIDNDSVGDCALSALNIGEAKTCAIKWKGRAGDHAVKVVANPSGSEVVAELDLSNNDLTGSVTVAEGSPINDQTILTVAVLALIIAGVLSAIYYYDKRSRRPLGKVKRRRVVRAVAVPVVAKRRVVRRPVVRTGDSRYGDEHMDDDGEVEEDEEENWYGERRRVRTRGKGLEEMPDEEEEDLGEDYDDDKGDEGVAEEEMEKGDAEDWYADDDETESKREKDMVEEGPDGKGYEDDGGREGDVYDDDESPDAEAKHAIYDEDAGEDYEGEGTKARDDIHGEEEEEEDADEDYDDDGLRRARRRRR